MKRRRSNDSEQLEGPLRLGGNLLALSPVFAEVLWTFISLFPTLILSSNKGDVLWNIVKLASEQYDYIWGADDWKPIQFVGDLGGHGKHSTVKICPIINWELNMLY